MMTLYRLALFLLPPGFRRAYGAALAEEAKAYLAEAAPGRMRAVGRLALDLARAVVREWWDAVVQATRNGMGGGMTTDLRQALRAMFRAPGFTAAVVGTLGLGIGATTVALGLVDTYLLRSLPYPDGERLHLLWPSENWSREMIAVSREGFPSLQGVAGMGGTQLVLTEGGEPEEIFASSATFNLFDVVGVQPVLGRGFDEGDSAPGAEPVAVLSHHLWVDRFGGDPGVLGRSVELGGDGHVRRTVVGVMPEGYLPVQGDGVEAWIPVEMDPTSRGYTGNYFMKGIGRLRPGATPEDASRDLAAFADRVATLHPEWFTQERIARATAPSLASSRSQDQRTPLLVALGASLLVLLVACANVANLVVARTTGRERELSVRAALGAGRVRTARVVLTEVIVLALAGALAGVAVAEALVRALARWFPEAIPDWGLPIDVRWVLAAVGLAALSALVAGLVPAVQASRRDPASAMSGGRGTNGHRRLTRLQELLSATQLAMATAGVAAMGLLGQSLLQLGRVDPGFDAHDAITFRVTAPPAAYPTNDDVVRFFREAQASLARVPGVTAAGFVSRLPLTGGESQITVEPEGMQFSEGDPRPVAWHRLITPGYLEAMGARLVEGRIPGPSDDRDDAPELVVVNRSAARAYWPHESALGKTFLNDGDAWLTVVGVIEDLRERGQSAPTRPGLYLPHRDWGGWRSMSAVVRTRNGAAAALLPELKKAVWAVSATTPISRVESLERVAAEGLRATRTLALLAAVAGAVTLLLGALGIYGVVSHAVARRTRELGVRAALGAGRTRLLRGALAGATRIVGVGLATGLFLAWMVGRALRGTLFGVGALDVPSLAAAATLLGAVAYLAAWLPARRAATVDPARVMREE